MVEAWYEVVALKYITAKKPESVSRASTDLPAKLESLQASFCHGDGARRLAEA